MSSPSSLFRTVVDKNAPRRIREDAIDGLAEEQATTRLRLIVVASGLPGRYRRQALDALGRCRATNELDTLANDTNIAHPLRKRARAAR